MNKLRIFLPVALVLLFMVGCQNKEAKVEFEGFKARVALEEQNMGLAKRYIDAINEGNFEPFEELLSPGYAIYSPSGYPQPSSREKLIENYQGVRKAFPQFTWSMEDMMASKDKVACRIIIRGTFKGGMAGLPAGEKEFRFSLITIMRMENGKIVEEWQEDDQLGFVRQLGMELKPKEEPKTR